MSKVKHQAWKPGKIVINRFHGDALSIAVKSRKGSMCEFAACAAMVANLAIEKMIKRG